MNGNIGLQDLYKLEQKLQLVEAELKDINENVPDLKTVLTKIESLNDKFERNRKDVWEFINTLTLSLREGGKKNGKT